MNIMEARRTRHLMIRLQRGDELPATLLRVLNDVEARSGWFQGMGTLESVEVVTLEQSGHTSAKPHRLNGPWEVVALTGNLAVTNAELSLRLSATLARNSDLGLQVAAGQIAWARVETLDLQVIVFDDLALIRTSDDRTASTAGDLSRSAISAADMPSPPIPIKSPARQRQEEEQIYPEVDDSVTHFHFGECVVIGSDGEKIRIRQDNDGRVREVSLEKLRVEPPTIDPASGKRHFHLLRKN